MYRNRSTNRCGGNFTREEIIAVWCKAQVVPGFDAAILRKDGCRAWIAFNEYGNTNSQHGWEVDHIIAVANGGADSLNNLQPLNWRNNRAKGDSSPLAAYCEVSAAS